MLATPPWGPGRKEGGEKEERSKKRSGMWALFPP